MLFAKKGIFIITLLIAGNSVFSQTEYDSSKEPLLPFSIYANLAQSNDLNNTYLINQRLHLKNLEFISIDIHGIEDGYFTIPLKNFGKTPTKYVFETYQKIYHNMNLRKSFFKLADLYNVPHKPKK